MTIVVGIDFSPASATVLDHAAKIAASSGAVLLVAHVIDSSRLSHWKLSRPAKTDERTLHDLAEAKLEALVSTCKTDCNMSTVVVTGRPADEIQKLVQDKEAGLLVIAANDLTKERLGSIASRCVRVVGCDVLVLRDWQERGFTKIIACIDLSPASEPVISRGIKAAKLHNASLEFVHVIYPPEKDAWGELLDEELPDEMFERVRKEAKDEMSNVLYPFKEELEGIDYKETTIESTVPSVALTHHIGDSHADMAVLGTHGHTKLGAYFLGTNAERLLHDVPVSVLAVR